MKRLLIGIILALTLAVILHAQASVTEQELWAMIGKKQFIIERLQAENEALRKELSELNKVR